CYTANGEDYRGRQNQTSLDGGRPCLFWNETFERPYNTNKYPNGEGGLGTHNFCRSSRLDDMGSESRIENGRQRLTEGCADMRVNGKEWLCPYEGLVRNPDGDVRPWCYIADLEDGIYWKYCDIPTCQMPGNLGCFKDSGDPTPLSGDYQTSNKLTIQNCISFCRNQRYTLAGMESGYACFCGNDLDYHRHGDAPSTECNHVCFGDHTQPCGGDGRVIVFDTKVGACGGNYTSPSAVIYSPDFPDKYRPGRVCYWTIQVPGASVILFNFTFFNIVDQTDMVEVLDGYTNQVVARFDGRNPPRGIVNITADFVILYFYSDRTNEAQGFAVLYQAFRNEAVRAEEDEDEEEEDSSTVQPHIGSTTGKSNTSESGKSSHLYYVITTSPANMPGQWHGPGRTVGHSTSISPSIPSISGSDSCAQSTTSEPWIIFYRPSTISLFKKKLKSHHGDLSPLVGN
ncbi:hypothetical protein DNTS_003189, partial [Danionella cerebrum]